MGLFKIKGSLSKQQEWILTILGLVLIVAMWWGLAESFATMKEVPVDDNTTIDSLGNLNGPTKMERVYPILPRPDKVFSSFKPLYSKDELLSNTWHSIWLNIKGYFWAILIALPFGFLLGLIPLVRGLFSKPIDSLRYLPLSALTGLFIIWFGIDDAMKIAFLAFGILVYLLPVIVQRINEVEDTHIKTAYTLGASQIQMLKTVYIPSVMSKVIEDIRVLTAISWTYIIIAELLNRTGGIGSLIFIKARQGQIDRVFALLIIIILIGLIQDRLFAYIDKRLFPHKHYKSQQRDIKEVQWGIYGILALIVLMIALEIFAPGLAVTVGQYMLFGIVACVGFIVWGEYKLYNSLKHG